MVFIWSGWEESQQVCAHSKSLRLGLELSLTGLESKPYGLQNMHEDVS